MNNSDAVGLDISGEVEVKGDVYVRESGVRLGDSEMQRAIFLVV